MQDRVEKARCAGRRSGDDYNTAEHENKVYHHPKLITPDKLPAFLKAAQ